MGIYKRLPRGKTRPAAAIPTWLDHAYHWLEINWKIVLSSIGAGVVFIGLVLGLSAVLGSRDDAAKDMFYKASSAPPASDAAVALYDELLKKHPRGNVAGLARLKLGEIYYQRGDYKKAEAAWGPLETAGEPELRVFGLHNIAAAREAAGDASGAAEAYLKAYSYPKNNIKGTSYFYAALAFKKAGEADRAKKILEEIVAGDKDEKEYAFTPDLIEKGKQQLIWMSINK